MVKITDKDTDVKSHRKPIPTDPDALLNESQASQLLGVSVRTLQGWRLRGGSPVYVKVGRCVRYRRRDLVSWVDENSYSSTSQTA